MSNLTSGIRPQPYGMGGRKVVLPVKATAQIYEGAFVAQISGACCTGTTSGAGNAIGVAESDMLGGASDGSTRIVVWTEKVFIFPNGTNAVADSTPYGTPLFMEDDHTVGTGGIGGSGEGLAGYFVGFEDDGRVRVYVGTSAGFEAFMAKNGANLADSATDTATVLGRVTRYKLPTLSQNCTVTLSTTGAVVGDVIRIVRTDTSAHTLAVQDGGSGTPTLCTLVASKVGFAQAYFDGTNWQLDGCSGT